MTEEHYEPSYYYPEDKPGVDPIYYDTIIAEKDGLVWTFVACGDGHHVNQVAVSGLSNGHIRADSHAFHTGELEKFLRTSDSLVAIRNHEVIYKKGA